MKIYCGGKPVKKKPLEPVIPAGQLVNKLGAYLYRHIDLAVKFEKKANMYDVYIVVLYEIPKEIIKKYNITDKKYLDVNEMMIDINITTYQNKIRVNTIEVTPEEQTLGFDLFPPEKLQDLNTALELIMAKVQKRVEKWFEGWDFVF